MEPRRGEVAGAVRLWDSVFRDGEDFYRLLFANGFLRPENIFSLSENGRTVSALAVSRFPVLLDGPASAAYLCNAATEPTCRRRGYMSRLLDFTVKCLRKEEYALVCLIPATEALFDLYTASGFRKGFFLRRTVFPGQGQAAHPADFLAPASPDLQPLFEQKYRREGYVYKDRVCFLRQIQEYSFFSQTGYFRTGDGAAFLSVAENTLTAREFAGIEESELGCLLSRCFRGRVVVESPSPQGTANGMVLPFTPTAEAFFRSGRGYLNAILN